MGIMIKLELLWLNDLSNLLHVICFLFSLVRNGVFAHVGLASTLLHGLKLFSAYDSRFLPTLFVFFWEINRFDL